MIRNRYRRIILFFARLLTSFFILDVLLPRLGLGALTRHSRTRRMRSAARSFRLLAVEMGGVLIKVGQFLSTRVDVLPVEVTGELAGLQDEVPAEDFADIRRVAEAEFGLPLEEKFASFDPVPLAAASLGQVHRAKIRVKAPPAGEPVGVGAGVPAAAGSPAGIPFAGGLGKGAKAEKGRTWEALAEQAAVMEAEADSSPTKATVFDTLSEDGLLDVVVKIQRPEIETLIATDLAALRTVGNWLQRYGPIRRRADVPALLGEFTRILYEEIDYLAEGRNAETFAANFADDPNVRVPAVAWTHTTRRALTLQNVYSIKISDYEAITAAGIRRAEVADRLLDTYLKQIFEDGFFHADPHPGNLFVYPYPRAGMDGHSRWQLTFIDFGMVGRISPRVKQGLREMVIGVGMRDTARVVRSYQQVGVLLPTADLELLEKAEARVFDRYWGKNMSELTNISTQEIMELMREFRELLYTMPFQVPHDLIFLGRAVAILSGMCTALDPQFNVWEHLAPYAQKLVADEARNNAGFWLDELKTLGRSLLSVPVKMDAILAKLDRGEIAVRAPEVIQQVNRLDGALRQVAGAIVFAALLLGGTQLLLAGQDSIGQLLLGAAGLVFFWTVFFARRKH